MKFSETPEEFVVIRDKYISDRWEQLAELQQIWLERVVRFLVLINAGGAVAVLAYMGTDRAAADSNWIRWMLVLYVAGVIAIGFLIIYSQHSHDFIYKKWREETNLFNEDKITWFDLTDGDIKRSSHQFSRYFATYVSFGMFLLASFLGAWNLLICQ